MMLFDVPDWKRVRITTERIRWAALGGEITLLGENVTWEGTTTGSRKYLGKARRRLIIEHTLEFYVENGVWQRDIECEVIG